MDTTHPPFKLSKKTRTRLALVRDYILRYPERFNMQMWSSNIHLGMSVRMARGKVAPNGRCGTTACIAGWYARLLPKAERPIRARVWQPLAKALGLNVPLCSNLDAPGYGDGVDTERYNTVVLRGHWPEPFKTEYAEAMRYGRRYVAAGVAAQRIQHLLDKGE